LPFFPRHPAFSSEGGYQGRFLKGGTTMKSNIRTFVLAAIAAASLAAFPHRGNAQLAFAANATTTAHTLPQNGLGTINAIILPKAGTYVIGGQQTLLVYATTALTPVLCYTSNQAGSETALPDGPYSMTTVQAPGGYVTLPLNGYYTAETAPVTIYVECRYFGVESTVAQLTGTLTATQVK
jgi:hypothetical protein